MMVQKSWISLAAKVFYKKIKTALLTSLLAQGKLNDIPKKRGSSVKQPVLACNPRSSLLLSFKDSAFISKKQRPLNITRRIL